MCLRKSGSRWHKTHLMLRGARQVVVQAALLAVLHHQSHLAVGGVRANTVHRQDVVVRVVFQLLVELALVVNSGRVPVVRTVALDGHRQPALHVLREVNVAKGALAQAAGVGQVGVGHQSKPNCGSVGCQWCTGNTGRGIACQCGRGRRGRCGRGGRRCVT
jgi:hypothetical protein